MTINNIEKARQRILQVVCPYCKAAVTALCQETYWNAAGKQTRFTNIFHAERIAKAQTIAERARDFTDRIRVRLNAENQAKENQKIKENA